MEDDMGSVDRNVEELLFNRLMGGHTLLDQCCPNCSTPLVKSDEDAPPSIPSPSSQSVSSNASESVGGDHEEFEPKPGIPFCVACEAHVATNNEELARASALLSGNSSRRDKKGSLLVAIEGDLGAMSLLPTYTTTPKASNTPKSTQLQEADLSETESDVAPLPEQPQEKQTEKTIVRELAAEPIVATPYVNPFVAAAQDSFKSMASIMASPRSAVPEGSNAVEEESVGDGDPREEIPTGKESQNKVKSEMAIAATVTPSGAPTDDFAILSEEGMMPEYKARRDMATKVLGAKMLQGYVLKETPCTRCGMPLMDLKGTNCCVVCPVLVKRAKKIVKEREEDEVRKKREAEEKKKAEEMSIIEEQRRRREEDERRAAEIRQKALEQLENEKEERERAKEAARLKAEMELRAAEEARRLQEERLLEERRRQEEERQREEERRRQEEIRLEAERRIEIDRQREEERARKEAEKEADILRLVDEMKKSEHTKAMVEGEQRRREEEEKIQKAEMEMKAAEAISRQAERKAVELERLAKEASISEQAKAKDEEESKKQAEEEKRRKAEEDARLRAEEERRINQWLEEETTLAAERRAEEELARIRATEASRKKSETDEARRRDAEERLRLAEEAYRQEEEDTKARLALEEEKKEEEERLQHEEESFLKLQEDRQLREEQEEKQRIERESIRREQEEMNQKVEVENRKVAASLLAAEKRAKGNEALIQKLAAEAKEKEEEFESDRFLNFNFSLPSPVAACVSPRSNPVDQSGATPKCTDVSDREKQKHWAVLRREGRAQMSRRIQHGWLTTGEYCRGPHCGASPLMSYRGGDIECVVCGGVGDGADGAYAIPITPRSPRKTPRGEMGVPTLTERVTLQPSKQVAKPVPVSDPAGDLLHVPVVAPKGLSIDRNPLHEVTEAVSHIVKMRQQNEEVSEARRTKISREIGRRMLSGWILLETVCPTCSTPLMSEFQGGPRECVSCDTIDFAAESAAIDGNKNDTTSDAQNVTMAVSKTEALSVLSTNVSISASQKATSIKSDARDVSNASISASQKATSIKSDTSDVDIVGSLSSPEIIAPEGRHATEEREVFLNRIVASQKATSINSDTRDVVNMGALNSPEIRTSEERHATEDEQVFQKRTITDDAASLGDGSQVLVIPDNFDYDDEKSMRRIFAQAKARKEMSKAKGKAKGTNLPPESIVFNSKANNRNPQPTVIAYVTDTHTDRAPHGGPWKPQHPSGVSDRISSDKFQMKVDQGTLSTRTDTWETEDGELDPLSEAKGCNVVHSSSRVESHWKPPLARGKSDGLMMSRKDDTLNVDEGGLKNRIHVEHAKKFEIDTEQVVSPDWLRAQRNSLKTFKKQHESNMLRSPSVSMDADDGDDRSVSSYRSFRAKFLEERKNGLGDETPRKRGGESSSAVSLVSYKSKLKDLELSLSSVPPSSRDKKDNNPRESSATSKFERPPPSGGNQASGTPSSLASYRSKLQEIEARLSSSSPFTERSERQRPPVSIVAHEKNAADDGSASLASYGLQPTETPSSLASFRSRLKAMEARLSKDDGDDNSKSSRMESTDPIGSQVNVCSFVGGSTRSLSTASRVKMTPPRPGVKLPPRPDSFLPGSENVSQSPAHSHARSHRSFGSSRISVLRDDDDAASVGSDEGSRCPSVATDALSTIMDKIERAKSQLKIQPKNKGSRGGEVTNTQMEMAKLIEKLASAAVAVKKLEEL